MYLKVQTAEVTLPGFGTSLPASPADGDEFILVDSLTAPTYQWLLRYVSAKSSNKWIFLGGTPARATVAASEATTSQTYADLATVGPSLTIAVAGSYRVRVEALANAAVGEDPWASPKIGAAAASDLDAAVGHVGSDYSKISSESVKTIAASDVVKVQYKTLAGGTINWQQRILEITPVAIGG